jgi:hypothetical protein
MDSRAFQLAKNSEIQIRAAESSRDVGRKSMAALKRLQFLLQFCNAVEARSAKKRTRLTANYVTRDRFRP